MLKLTDGLNKVIHGDSIEIMSKMESESIDLIVADPPYNVGKDYGNNSDKQGKEEYLEFSETWMKEAVRLLKKSGTLYVFGGKKYIAYMYIILEKLKLKNNGWIVWHYTQGAGRTKGYSSRHDDILVFTKSNNYTFNLDNIRIPQKYYRKANNMRGANPGNVWSLSHVHYSEGDRTIHPTQKPHALYERMILASSNEGDIVLDPFAGSGSSLVVSKNTRRNFIGIEIESQFVDLCNEELEKDYKFFNSYFKELLRIPNNFSEENMILDYLNNHKKWFLEKYHSNLIPIFEDEIIYKYGKEIFDKYKINENETTLENIEKVKIQNENKQLKLSL